MGKTITFSFTSDSYVGTEATETFTFEDLRLDEQMDEKELEIEMDRIYHAWVWSKFNISASIIVE